MERIFAVLVSCVCLSISHVADAQNNTNIYDSVFLVSNPQTARWSYIETDRKGNQLDGLVHNTIKEKYPDLSEDKKKEVLERLSQEFPNKTIYV